MLMEVGSSSSKFNTSAQSAFKPYKRLEDSQKMTNHLQVTSIEEQSEYYMQYWLQKIQELVNGNVEFFAREIELAKLKESRRMKTESKRPMESSLSDEEVEEYRRMKRESKRPMESPPPDDKFDNKQVKESKKRKIKIESKQCHVEQSSAFVDEDTKKKMRKLRIRKIQKEIEKRLNGNPLITNEVTERLQAYISDDLNGSYIMPVIQKLLYSSDIKSNQNRLSMPINQVIKTSEFLTPQEKSVLDKQGEIKVSLLGPDLQMHKLPMKLIIWDMVSTQSYVLKTNWSNFVRQNEKDLKENSIVQVWSFRKDQKLCFALAVVEGPDPRFSVEEGSSSSLEIHSHQIPDNI